MNLPLQFFLLISLLIQTVDSAKTRRCIAKNGKYSDPADSGLNKCRKCQTCHAGLEWDFNADIRTSADYGDLECLPCIPCKEGHYKDNNIFTHCSPCVLDCETLNRYLQQPCGGLVRGHCGSCKPGFEDIHNNIEMRCTPIAKKNQVAPKSKKDEINLIAKHFPSRSAQKSTHWTPDKVTAIVLPVCSTIAVIAILVIVIGLIRLKERRSRDIREGRNRGTVEAEDISSRKRLLQSKESVQSDQMVKKGDPERPEYVTEIPELDATENPELSRVDVDGPPLHGLVRSELQNTGANKHNDEQEQPIDNPLPPLQYRDKVLNKDDPILDTVAAHVYGDNVMDKLCSELEIPEQSRFEHRYLWVNKSHSLKEYVLKVLMVWIEKGGPDATLFKLYDALRAASCVEALSEMETALQESFNRY